jgi:D-beta-D-heptose 7-phosphate kinase/D-beta-D-heptose 1-phosphate adenosyltransferase
MKIIILGDVMVDINYHCNTTRFAPEANIPLYNVLNTNHILGGAANVANNLKNLDCNIEIVSVIGEDNIGLKIKELFDEKNIKHHLLIDNTRKTTQKNRIFHEDILITRYDIEDTHDISKDIEKETIDYITTIETLDVIIFSDYAKGFLTQSLCEKIIKYANMNNILTFVDPKPKNIIKYKKCFCIKLNLLEGKLATNESSKKDILKKIKDNIECEFVILTCGEDGMYVNTIENHIIQNKKEVKDVTGSGDIVLTVTSYMYLQNKDMIESAKLANYIAGKGVEIIGNYSVSKQDIYEYIDNVIHDTEIEKIKMIRKSNKNIVFTNGCFDLIHSAHIRLLQFSKKQGDILVVGLNSNDSIKRFKGDKRPINDITERCELLKNLGVIDYIIIFNDDTPFHILELLRPDIMVKGGDYTIEQIIGKDFAKEIILYNYINGISSTNTIAKINNIPNNK